MKINIRQAQKTDINKLVMLLKDLFSIEADFEFDPNKQCKGLEMLVNTQTACILIAEYNGEVVGMCTAQTLISTAEGGSAGLIEDMVVKQPFRSQGIGKQLLKAIENWCKQQNFSRIQLLADNDNTPALEFYKSQHWRRTNLICLRKRFQNQG